MHTRNNQRKTKTIEVVAAVIRKGGKIFATQRGYGEFKDWWEFPGGKMKAGESTIKPKITSAMREQAVKRERLTSKSLPFLSFLQKRERLTANSLPFPSIWSYQ